MTNYSKDFKNIKAGKPIEYWVIRIVDDKVLIPKQLISEICKVVKKELINARA